LGPAEHKQFLETILLRSVKLLLVVVEAEMVVRQAAPQITKMVLAVVLAVELERMDQILQAVARALQVKVLLVAQTVEQTQ
jgi:hypothetical protein